jgi:hypothetical protein
MILQYGLLDAWKLDSFHKMSKKEYTFDNGWSDPGATISCIDKFLVSHELHTLGGRIELAPLLKRLLNHSPLVLTLWGQPNNQEQAKKYFDTSLLRDDGSKKKVLQAWEGSEPKPTTTSDWADWLEAATERVMWCNMRLAKEKKRARGALVRVHNKRI